jgi:biotin carboxylase
MKIHWYTQRIFALQSNIQMKKILVINLGWEQVPLIDYLAGLTDCQLFGIHSSNDPYRSEIFKTIHTCDLRDLPSILDFAKSVTPDAVISDQCDYSLFAQAVVAEKFNLPGPSLISAQLANNKYLQRERAHAKGLTIPAYKLCTVADDVKTFGESYGYPLIVKPLDNRGSFGVVKIESPESVDSGFIDALIHSHSRQVIVEEFIEGIHITVDGYAFKELGPKSLSLATKQLVGEGAQVAVGIVYPGDLKSELFEKAMSVNEIVNKSLGYDFGMIHSEYMIRGEEIYLIESANRGGGVFTSEIIVPSSSGVDLLSQYAADCLGETCSNYKMPDHNQVVLRFFSFAPGCVIGVEGWENITKNPRILASEIFIKLGDTISPITSDANRHGFFILEGSSDDAEAIFNTVKVNYA